MTIVSVNPEAGLTLRVFSVKSINRDAGNHDYHVDAAYQENPRDDCGSEGHLAVDTNSTMTTRN